MKKLSIIILSLLMSFACSSGGSGSSPDPDDKGGNGKLDMSNLMTITDKVINSSFVGNGPQWGGYDILKPWIGSSTLSDQDWETLFKRVSFMSPSFMRIMISQGWNYMDNDVFTPSKSDPVLCRILDYCQNHDITVQLGEWGHVGGSVVDLNWVDRSTDFLSYLVKDKKFTCIKYFTVVNEPNGNWSTTNGNYALWKSIITNYHKKMSEKSLDSQVKLMGPDVAIWTLGETTWLSNTRKELADQVGAYDIHTYPTDKDVYTTSFLQLLKGYKAACDPNKIIMLGELGFKYDASSSLGIDNLNRINADQFACSDSQMHVYDSFYAIDMADATIQAMMAGFGGVSYWDLDDAMYNEDGSSSKGLKRWGYWNILGKECFNNPDDENIRPWFYTTSLLCRYFPKGTKIYEMQMPSPVLSGLRAIVGSFNSKMTIAIVNSSTSNLNLKLASDIKIDLTNLKKYYFKSLSGSKYEGTVDNDGFATPKEENVSFNFTSTDSYSISMPAKSFVLITNM